MVINVAADEAVGDDAHREGGEDDARRDEEEIDEVVEVECVCEYGQVGLLSKDNSMRLCREELFLCCHEAHTAGRACDEI